MSTHPKRSAPVIRRRVTIIQFLRERGVQDRHMNVKNWCPHLSAECPKLRELAAPYADHPDYRKEWTQ